VGGFGWGHLQVGQAAALAVQLLDLVGVADVALVQRRLLGIVGRLQVLEIALVPKFYIAADAGAVADLGSWSDSDSDSDSYSGLGYSGYIEWAEVEVDTHT